MPRRKNDFYPTLDTNAIGYLMKYWDIPTHSNIFECCNGEGHLSNQLVNQGFVYISKGDIDGDNPYFNACNWLHWQKQGKTDYVITNPPFKHIMSILPLAYEYSHLGVAMLLPLNFLEPCYDRYQWLADHPISKQISIPRISFTGNGRTAMVATAWFVWDKQSTTQEIIVTR